jgi:hypothetical protein
VSYGIDEETGAGAAVKSPRLPAQTVSASRIVIPTFGSDPDEKPGSVVTARTSKATVPSVAPLEAPVERPVVHADVAVVDDRADAHPA